MKVYEIWSEGYIITGNSSGARFHGMGYGKTFKDACISFMNNDKDRHLFDEDRMTYWGCRLFDNELEARESFG